MCERFVRVNARAYITIGHGWLLQFHVPSSLENTSVDGSHSWIVYVLRKRLKAKKSSWWCFAKEVAISVEQLFEIWDKCWRSEEKDTSPALTVFRCILLVLAMPAEFGATKVSCTWSDPAAKWRPEWHCTYFSEASPDRWLLENSVESGLWIGTVSCRWAVISGQDMLREDHRVFRGFDAGKYNEWTLMS